ncbi:hypothetical protein GCM10020216_012670 [Nonomuraea helvata]
MNRSTASPRLPALTRAWSRAAKSSGSGGALSSTWYGGSHRASLEIAGFRTEVVDRELAPAELRVPPVLRHPRAARHGQHHAVELRAVTVDQARGPVDAVRCGRAHRADAHGAELPGLDLAPQRGVGVDPEVERAERVADDGPPGVVALLGGQVTRADQNGHPVAPPSAALPC